MEKKYILIEKRNDSEILTENTKTGKKYYLEGTYLQSNIKNKNGRIYPKNIMETAVDTYIRSHITENIKSAYGELGHPKEPKEAAYVNESNISHLITNLTWSNDNVEGKSSIIPAGKGLIAIGMLEMGGDIGMSSRALGSVVKRNGYVEVQKDLRFITAADIVINPSAPDAWMNGIMECADFITKSEVWSEEEIEDVQKEIKAISSVDKTVVAERQAVALEKFLKSLLT